MGYWLTGWTGDNAGEVIGREPNTLLVAESASDAQWSSAFMYPVQVQGRKEYPYLYVDCLTPGSRRVRVWEAKRISSSWNALAWSLELVEVDMGDDKAPWEPGVHVFSLGVSSSVNFKPGFAPLATTLATAVIERVRKVDLTSPGEAIAWIEAMERASEQGPPRRPALDTRGVDPGPT